MLEALIWDIDGTIAETERDGHRLAFNQAFQSLGLHWHWDPARYGELLHITGGRERLVYDMDNHRDAPADPAERAALAAVLHRRKNEAYADIVAMGRIVARPGVRRLLEEARAAGLRQAIATTTSRTNVDALLSGWFGRQWQERFVAVVCGEDVQHKKPHPEVYTRTLDQLAVPVDRVLAFEDSGPGLRSASAAGLAVVLAPSVYFEASCAEAVAECTTPVWQVKDLDHPVAMDLAALRAWFDSVHRHDPPAG